MKCYGHKTPKRSSMWSNSKKVYKFRTSKLKRSNKYTYSNLVKRYRNKEGKARFVGNRKALKNSAIPGEICVGLVLWYACLFVWVLFQNVVNQHAMEPKVLTVHISWNPRRYPLGFGLQYLRVFDDLKKSNQETRQTFCHEVFVYSCRKVQPGFGWVMGWI